MNILEKVAFNFDNIQHSPPPNAPSVDNMLQSTWPDRLNFYTILYDTLSLNPEVIKSLFRAIDLNAGRIARLEKSYLNAKKAIKHMSSRTGSLRLPEDDRVKINTLLQDIKLVEEGRNTVHGIAKDVIPGGGRNAETVKKMLNEIDAKHKHAVAKICAKLPADIEGRMSGGEPPPTIFDPYLQQLKAEDVNVKINVDLAVDQDPYLSEDARAVSMEDRALFIAVSFMIRMITLFLVEWAIHTEMVADFKSAFMYYIGIYCLLIVFITFIVSSSSIGVQVIFYYMNVNTHGYAWLGAHVFTILVLMPVLYVLKDNTLVRPMNNTTFEYKRSLSTSISNITFVIWLLTSLLALKL